jgi:hypothetical protein
VTACSRSEALPRTPGQYAIHQIQDQDLTEEMTMQIGEPLRTIVVEPLELPVGDPQTPFEPEPAPQPEPEPEQMPAKR